MPTHTDIKRGRQLLDNLGLLPVKEWPVHCTWYKPDGSIHGTLPCDPYSGLLYMSRGLRPSVGKRLLGREPVPTPSAITSVPLVDTLVEFMADKTVWNGTASELHTNLVSDDMPKDAIRLSKELSAIIINRVQRHLSGAYKSRSKTWYQDVLGQLILSP